MTSAIGGQRTVVRVTRPFIDGSYYDNYKIIIGSPGNPNLAFQSQFQPSNFLFM